MSNKPDLHAMAERIRASGIPTHFDEPLLRLLLAVWREVLKGEAVPMARVDRLVAASEVTPADGRAFIERLSERDQDGDVVGIFGLSQRPHPHRFLVDGRQFWTWCAWDALFLPPLLGQPARIESCCPQTGVALHVLVTPAAVTVCSPPDMVLSVVLPSRHDRVFAHAEEVWSAFCCDVRLFKHASAAHQWRQERSREIEIVSVADGFELGRIAFRELVALANDERQRERQ